MSVDKLVDSTALDSNLTLVANAIRAKGGTSASLAFPSGFVSAISGITTGISLSTVLNRTFSQVSDLSASYVGPYAFAECRNLRSASFPNAKSISKYAFFHCGLTDVNVGTARSSNDLNIYEGAFQQCDILYSFNAPTAYYIYSSAFQSCELLAIVSIPNASTIYAYAFANCECLCDVTLDSLRNIGSYAFSGCVSLSMLELPQITNIYPKAFDGCSNLSKLLLLKSYCVNLSNSNAFDGTPLSAGGSGHIYVLTSLYSTYINANPWSTISARIVGYTPTSCKTVLYQDADWSGDYNYVLIINEPPSERANHLADYGIIVEEWDGLDALNPYIFDDGDNPPPWAEYAEYIKEILVDSPIQPESTAYWFYGCGISTNMPLTIDLFDMDTSHTTDMSHMFEYSTVQYADGHGFDTSAITDMSSMYTNCNSLESAELYGWDTSNVINMSSMFAYCEYLLSANMAGHNLESVVDMSYMFINCRSLSTVYLNNITTQDIEDLSYMFESCETLTSLDLSNFDTSNVTSMQGMFEACYTLATIIASPSFVTTNVTTSSDMFNGCDALVGGSGTAYASAYVANALYARIDNPPSAPGYFTAATLD